MQYFDEEAGPRVGKAMAETDAFLFGGRTYEIMSAYWPNAPEGDMFAGVLNGLPKYVASTTLREPLSWSGSTLLEDDVPTAVAELREQAGRNLVILGSGRLVRSLIEHDLVDAYGLMIHRLLLGSGKHLFQDLTVRLPLRLVDSG